MNTEKTVKVIYWLSEEGRKKSLLAGGNGEKEQILNVPATKRLIEMADCDKNGSLELRVKVQEYNYDHSYKNTKDKEFGYKKYFINKRYFSWKEQTLFDDIQTIDSILNAYDETEKMKKELEAGLDKKNEDSYNEALKEYKERKKEEEIEIKEQKERDRKRNEKLEAIQKEKENWIRKHGSKYLNDCLDLDKKANLEYVVERAELEYPDYTVDYAENAEYETKVSPSQEALNELRELRENNIESDIVWLTKPAKIRNDEEDGYYYDEPYEPYDPCEAIVIKNYLDKYELYKEM